MTYKRLFSIFLAVLIIVSSLAFALPVMANNSNRTLVKPFIPLKTVGVGDATVKLEKIKLFENSDLAVMSSENEIGGLPIEKTETVDKGYMVVTPLVSGSQISFNSSTVTASMVAVTDKTSEKGVKIVPSPSLSGGKVV